MTEVSEDTKMNESLLSSKRGTKRPASVLGQGSKSSDVPLFVRTLHTLLEECDQSISRWSDDGTKVLIMDPARFAVEICPRYFRHRNFNSFTRLLNMYQFHKVQNASPDAKVVCFAHFHFLRDKKDGLSKIQRKSSSSSGEVEGGQPRTGIEALVARDVWEKTNQEIDQMQKRLRPESLASVSTWMRKVLDLERETKQLRETNHRLRQMEKDRAQLCSQIAAQNQLILKLRAEIQQRKKDANQDQSAAVARGFLNLMALHLQAVNNNATESDDASTPADDPAAFFSGFAQAMTSNSSSSKIFNATPSFSKDMPAPPCPTVSTDTFELDPLEFPDLSHETTETDSGNIDMFGLLSNEDAAFD
uniref:HSF-type DNA-binding domain-containing protein n=1 Tax=Aureoumbra lagunensis TaxID=44058 RepID=A0A7S3K4F8_9STRA